MARGTRSRRARRPARPHRRRNRRAVWLTVAVLTPVLTVLAVVLAVAARVPEEPRRGPDTAASGGDSAFFPESAPDSPRPEATAPEDFPDTGARERASATAAAPAEPRPSDDPAEEREAAAGADAPSGSDGPADTGSEPSGDLDALASAETGEVVRLVNAERADAGCDPVHVDARLTRAAQQHSEDMARRDYMAHESPEGEGPQDRAVAEGYHAWSAENVAAGQRSAAEVMESWMNSPGHRSNILDCESTAIGVGEADHRWTQMFGRE